MPYVNLVLTCEQCHRPYHARRRSQRFCSRACKYAWHTVERICPTCGKAFRVHHIHLGLKTYCSLSCTQRRPCLLCGRTITGRNKFKGERQFCSRACSGQWYGTLGGTISYVIKGFVACLLRHEALRCERCGWEEVGALEVHHLDRNRSNNADTNLLVLCANCHRSEHKRDTPRRQHTITVAHEIYLKLKSSDLHPAQKTSGGPP